MEKEDVWSIMWFEICYLCVLCLTWFSICETEEISEIIWNDHPMVFVDFSETMGAKGLKYSETNYNCLWNTYDFYETSVKLY
jgi:hypothetical protein